MYFVTGRLCQQGSSTFIVQIVSKHQKNDFFLLQIHVGQDTNKGYISKPQYPLLKLRHQGVLV